MSDISRNREVGYIEEMNIRFKIAIAMAGAAILLLMVLVSLWGGDGAASATPTAEGSLDEQLTALLATDTDVDYRVHAFRLGISKTASRGLFIKDSTLPKRIPIAFAMWLIESRDRRILVDTGFVNKGMIEKWNITDYAPPMDALKNAGFDKDRITDVIVTHRHWDHVGGLTSFEDATIWIPKITFRSLRQSRRFRTFFDDAEAAGRLKKTEDLTRVAPGVVTVHVGLHAPGSQIVVVNRKGKRWILASDSTPLFANYERKKPTGQSSDPQRTLDTQETILKWVNGDLGRIVPGHEPSLFKGKAHVVVTDKSD